MKLLLLALLAATSSLAATYSYSVYNPSDAAISYSDVGNFTSNGPISVYPGAVTSSSNGSLILHSNYAGFAALPSQTNYEVSMAIALKQGLTVAGGDFVQYVSASSNALSTPYGTADTGTFAAVHLYNPTVGSDGVCTATLTFVDRTSAGSAYYYGSPVPCNDGMVMRTFVSGAGINVMVSGQVYHFSSRLSSGLAGFGVSGTATGAGISSIQIGPQCLTEPAGVAVSTISSSVFPNNVSLHWTEPTEPLDVATIGIGSHTINRAGRAAADFFIGTDYSDATVAASTNYLYGIVEVSFHGVASTQSLVSVTTPPAYDLDPRRTGLKPLGSYWGGAGEQIDMGSGNLNFTLPLVTAQGRGGWSVPFALSYNSQQWRKDAGGVWNLGQDVGYGYGWRLMAGSLTPYWNQLNWGVDHYLFIDSSGAEYRLYPESTGSNIWTSQLTASTASGGTPQSGEAIYVYYNSSTQMLHFTNGSFWYMGCTAAGTEQDGGTMYPTVMEDRNGNQILVRYMTGNGANYPNSSARISQIEDTRAVTSGAVRYTYQFTYSAADATGIAHIYQITNTIGTSEAYGFFQASQALSDPFAGSQKLAGTVDIAQTVVSFANLAYLFSYDASGEMTQAMLPAGGYLRWSYSPLAYTWSSETVTQMSVTGRYLASSNRARTTEFVNHGSACTQTVKTNCVNENAYTIAYTPATATQPVVPTTCLTDAADATGVQAYRCWNFVSETQFPWANGQVGDFVRKTSAAATTNLLHDFYTWFYEPTQGNSYLAYKTTINDENGSNPVYSQTYWLDDAYGNVLQSKIWDYTPNVLNFQTTAAPARTYTNTYASSTAYTNAYILNLLATSSVQDSAGNTATLATNTYDSYTGGIGSPASGAMEHDGAYGTNFTARGNLTTSVSPGKTVNIAYDLTGTPTGSDDGYKHAISLTTSSSTNYSAPATVQPNTGSSNDANLSTALSYSPFLGISQVIGANSMQTSAQYDSLGRLSQSTAATGAVTTMAYYFGAAGNTASVDQGPYTTTATTNTHWSSNVADGLGRTSIAQTGYTSGSTSTTVSEVDTVYGPCACTPIGKMIQTSQPYLPGASMYWTTYSYDGLGRTLKVTLPDNASSTTYTYQGNWTTVVDPAGKWKQFERDVFGNTAVVVEPDPSANPVLATPPASPSTTAAGLLVTSYTYDFVNHLTGVSMPRTGATQTRTFRYNASFQLASKTEPETGTTSYSYNSDGTLAARLDAKGQTTGYGYDAYQRLASVTHGSGNPLGIDQSQTVTYFYDTDPFDTNGTFATNTWGRVAAIGWGGPCSGYVPYLYFEEYAYNASGNVTAKQFTKTKLSNGSCSVTIPGTFFTAKFSYDSEGKSTSITYPAIQSGRSFTATNSYDIMSRLTGVTDVEGTGDVAGCGANFWNGALTWASNATYNPANQLSSVQYLSGVAPTCASANETTATETNTYNSLNQLTEIDATAFGLPSNQFAKYIFPTPGNNGQISGAFDGRLNYQTNYTYDALKRLTKAQAPSWTQTYTYDGFGNLTAKSAPAGSAEPTLPGINAATNQLTGVSYDANGNAQSSGSFALAYDMENRMVSTTLGSTVTTYTYDAANRRIEEVNPVTGDTFFFYAPDGRLLTSYTIPPGVTNQSLYPVHRIYFGSKLIGTTTSVEGGEIPVLADRLGTAQAGYPYGTDISGLSFKGSNDVDFATYRKDAVTGLDYANQRWYSSGLGRFTSADPSDQNINLINPISWNRFAYTNGDPVNSNDPNGLDVTCVGSSPDGYYSSGSQNGLNLGITCSGYDASANAPPDPNSQVDGPVLTGEIDTAESNYAQGLPFPSPGITGSDFAIGAGGVIFGETLGGVICVGSGACEVAVGIGALGVGIWGAWELGNWIGGAIQTSRGNQKDTGVQKLLQDLYPGVDPCLALLELLKQAKAAGDIQLVSRIITTQKAFGCRNTQKRKTQDSLEGPSATAPGTFHRYPVIHLGTL